MPRLTWRRALWVALLVIGLAAIDATVMLAERPAGPPAGTRLHATASPDLLSDRDNCGAPAFQCPGGASNCVRGVCAPAGAP